MFSLLRAFLSVLVISMFALGCNQGDERLVEKARIEGQASSEAATQSANESLAKKASEMESDLAVRHRFYQALKGTYEGAMETEQGEFKVKITLVPSLPPYATGRTRQLEEIAADLNNLYLNVQVVQWNPANRLSAVGCRIEQVRPDIVSGEISIASENCPNFYGLRIADEGANVSKFDPARSGVIASYVRDGRMDRVASIQGEVHPTTNASVYQISVSRNPR